MLRLPLRNTARRGFSLSSVIASFGVTLALSGCAGEAAPSRSDDAARTLPMASTSEDSARTTREVTLPDPEPSDEISTAEHGPSAVARGFLRYAMNADRECTVALPAEIDAALTAWNADFRVWRQVDYESFGGTFGCSDDHPPPFAVSGDFNADGIADVVLHGYDRQQTAFVAITSSPAVAGGYTLAVLEAYAVPPLEGGRPRLPEYAVGVAPPRRTRPCMPDIEPPINLTADNLFIGLADKPGETFYMERGVWKRTYEGC
jgi:hypothetical protein